MFPRVSPRGRKPAAAAATATYDDGLPDADSLRKAQQGAADDDPDGPIIGPDGEGVSSVVVGSSSFSLEAEALERATRDSVRTSVGAYSVVPGEGDTRREHYDAGNHSDGINNVAAAGGGIGGVSSSSSGRGGLAPFGMSSPMSPGMLPGNIDIVAEATLVEDHQYENHGTTRQQGGAYDDDDGDCDGDDDDADTLGLRGNDFPERGGVGDDSASVAVSAMTTPTVLRRDDDNYHDEATTSPTADDNGAIATRSADNNGEAATAPMTEDESRRTGRQSQLRTTDVEAGEAAGGGEGGGQTDQSIIVVAHAVPVNDGPFAFLETKSGRVAASVAAILMVVLAVGLGAGLTAGKNDEEVLTYSAGKFCSAGVPRVFHGRFQSLCSLEEAWFGGTMQQAMAVAQLDQALRRGGGGGSGREVDFSIVNAGAVRGEIHVGVAGTPERV